jgi:hypothetical protein
VRFLREQFARVDPVELGTCTPEQLRTADVAVLDWPKEQGALHWIGDMRVPPLAPLGELARWDRPTVLIGSAGLNFAAAWNLPGTDGGACLSPLAYGMRDHPLFAAPQVIDRAATAAVAVPSAWREALPGQERIAGLRLCDGDAPAAPGWCAVAVELVGPELEIMSGGLNTAQPTHAAIWRQGNLLHFGFEQMPGEYNATGRKLLVNAIAYAARFQTDRPIVRKRSFADPAGAAPSLALLQHLRTVPAAFDEPAANPFATPTVRRRPTAADLAALFAPPWREQLAALPLADACKFVNDRDSARCVDGSTFAFDQDALVLGIDVRDRSTLGLLVARLQGPDAATARRLLQRLLPDGPPAHTTPANWENWLRAREGALAFDPLSLVWRQDWLAHWRGENGSPQGPARADGDAVRDPAAVALAQKVAAFHGGARTFDDLQTFACRLGDVRSFWDRRAGVFRQENLDSIPAGRVTPWRVVIFDTAADDDILKGGPAAPGPTVSARTAFRQVMGQLFLPLLLLEPGTSLKRLPDADDQARLEVRLGIRSLDPRLVYVLHVDAATGALRAIGTSTPRAEAPDLPATVYDVEATMAVGPLRVPSVLVRRGRTPRRMEFTEAQWNPPVPAGLATAKEMLLGGK